MTRTIALLFSVGLFAGVANAQAPERDRTPNETRAADHPVVGDAAAGERFFNGAGNCSSCHMVRGRGGVLGPDLSNVARERSLEQIDQALNDPGGAPRGLGAAAPQAVSLRMRDGRTLRGLITYEGPFDLGLHAVDGKFHSVSRAEVAEENRERSLMFRLKASAEQTRNLLAYLSRLTIDRAPGATFTGAAESRGPQRGTRVGVAMGQGISFADIAHPKAGEWPSYNGQLSGNRHSSLDQINISNVAQLAPKWTFPIGGPRALQVTPVVVDGIMYVTAVNEARALDARTGRQIWQYSRPQTPGLVPTGDPAAGINRGVAALGDRVFLQTDHAHLLALHRLTGQLLWDIEMADHRLNYGATGAPLVVNDLVIAGISAGDEGVRGFLDAYKASTGERVWRFWTVPARGEPGSETWIGKALEHGCAATWLTGTYDPEARLLYWPTGNPCPDYNGDERKGDNLYSSSVVALDPDTGKLRWYFQFTPHDLHDWDANQPPLLLDAEFRGRPRKLLALGSRNGFFYVLDRLTGEFLLGEPFVKNLTWASGIGPDGRPQLLPGYENTAEGTRTCPSVTGAANWPSTSFNPATGLFYLMAGEACAVYEKNSQWFDLGKSFYGGTTRRALVEGGGKFLRALDLQTGKLVWEVPDVGGAVSAGGLMSTAGGLVIYGDNVGGALVAADAKTGKLLWHFNTGQVWKSSPMTYAINGKQYIGVVAGSTVMVFGLP